MLRIPSNEWTYCSTPTHAHRRDIQHLKICSCRDSRTGEKIPYRSAVQSWNCSEYSSSNCTNISTGSFCMYHRVPVGSLCTGKKKGYEFCGICCGLCPSLSETVVLVGIPAKDADTNYGWIEPSTSFLRFLGNRFYAVERFIEKPPIKLATMLHSKKCLWNSMVFAAQAETLLHLFRKSLPKVYHQVESMKQLVTSPGGIEKLDGQFTRLPSYGFSKTIMEPNAKHLRVIRAEGVTWSDWEINPV